MIRYARIEKIITDNPVEFLEPKDFTKHCGEIEVSDCDKYYTDTELAIILKALHGYYIIYAALCHRISNVHGYEG